MKAITVTLLDFADLEQGSDEQMMNRMIICCRSTKTPLLPRDLSFNAYRVSRYPSLITIHLPQVVDQHPSKQREIAQFSFAAPPDFSQRPVML